LLRMKSLTGHFLYVGRRRLIAFLIRVVPKMTREELIELGYQKRTLSVVEDKYVSEIPLPEQQEARELFGHLSGPREVGAFFGVTLDDVRVVGPYGVPITRSGRVVVEPFGDRWLPKVLRDTVTTLGIFGFLREYLLAVTPLLRRAGNDKPFCAHLLARGADWSPGGNGPNYGHWIAEQIPQLRAIEAIQKMTPEKIVLLINHHPAIWQLESLQLLGYDSDSIEHVNSPGVQIGKLVVSSLRAMHSRGMEFDPKARRWAAERLRSSVALRQSKRPVARKVAYFRTQQRTRTVANITDGRKVLRQFGFIEDEDRPSILSEVIEQSKAVEVFLAVTGSNVMRMMYSDRPRFLVEIIAPHYYVRDICFQLAIELGAKYSCVYGLEVPSVSGVPMIWQDLRDYSQINEPIYLPVSELKLALGAISAH